MINNKAYLGSPHRILVEDIIGRNLKKGWIIHHIDLNPENNSRNNLALVFNASGHARIHTFIRQAWYLNVNEATSCGKFFRWFSRKFRLMKYYNEKSNLISWSNDTSKGCILLKKPPGTFEPHNLTGFKTFKRKMDRCQK